MIPARYAFTEPDPETRVTFAGNVNPQFVWTDVPEGTRSLAMLCHDRDVPSKGDDVNQEGREVPADLPRVDFFHWVVVDLPSSLRDIEEAEFSDGVVHSRQERPEGPTWLSSGDQRLHRLVLR